MTQIKRGPVRRYAELSQTYLRHLVEGQVATDGVVYSSVATFGTTAVDVIDELIDPGMPLELQQIEVGLTQRFTELSNAVGSIFYHWRAREEWDALGTKNTGAWVILRGTLSKGIGSLANSEDTLSGYVGIGTLPRAPFRLRLTAQTLNAAQFRGEVKNSSYVRLVGTVIPGTV